jgi:UDPglucose 6-dehydrogenase
MNVAIVGSGYVGLVTGACLAEAGHTVTCIDNNSVKIEQMREGKLPFHEPGLQAIVLSQLRAGTLRFSTDLAGGTQRSEVVMLAIGTPSAADGCANIEGLLLCAKTLADVLHHSCVLAIKSTAPVGTCEQVQSFFTARRGFRSNVPCIQVASNPEFLAEGRAVEDFRNPDRIVIGAETAQAADTLSRLYAAFDPDGQRILRMDVRSAEFAKYACNAMLASRISLVNELANIAEKTHTDMRAVCQVLATDHRIGPAFLRPGAGYGGSCLPKDLRALIRTAEQCQESAPLLRAVEEVNQRQVRLLFDSIQRYFGGSILGRRIAIWGLAFKPGTDDVREAPSLALIRLLIDAGATVHAYDPVVCASTAKLIGRSGLTLCRSAAKACRHSEALVVMTEWQEFVEPDFSALAGSLESGAIFDARNLYRPEQLARYKLQHFRIGQKMPDGPLPASHDAAVPMHSRPG